MKVQNSNNENGGQSSDFSHLPSIIFHSKLYGILCDQLQVNYFALLKPLGPGLFMEMFLKYYRSSIFLAWFL